jgi:hypothetical protein
MAMKVTLGTLALVLSIAVASTRIRSASATGERRGETERESGFRANVRPILEQHCQPCHFAGGKMYARLPFDKPETITALGEKLFTRIKDEKERAAIRAFLKSAK